MESIPVSKFRASLKEYLDRMEAGEIINVNGLEIAKLSADSKVVQAHVQDVVQADVQIDYEKLAKLIVKGINHVQVTPFEVKEVKDFSKVEAFNNLKSTLGVDLFGKSKLDEYIEADAYSLGDNSLSWGEVWIKMKKSDLPKNFLVGNTRPVQEEVKLETYDTGFKTNERAATMNDGSKPIPKPVKKKKKDL